MTEQEFKDQDKKLVEKERLEQLEKEKAAGGKRWNKGKLEWGLVHFRSFENMVRVLMFGKVKYAAWNWADGLSVTQILESHIRHATAILKGENIDPDSGLPHYAHMQCNDMFLAYMMENKPEFDDRFEKNRLSKPDPAADKEYPYPYPGDCGFRFPGSDIEWWGDFCLKYINTPIYMPFRTWYNLRLSQGLVPVLRDHVNQTHP